MVRNPIRIYFVYHCSGFYRNKRVGCAYNQ